METNDKYILNSVKKILENGILLSISSSLISFYKMDESNNLVPTIDFQRFPYLQEFIDYIIEYRTDNDLEKPLTEENMESLGWNFVYDNAKKICERFDMKEQDALDYLEEVKANNERVGRELDRILKL